MGESDLKIFEGRSNTENLAVMLTHRCSMNCRYCFLDREKPDTKEEVVYRAIDLLCTSAAPEVELQFFGGEPLLRFDLVKKAIRYAQKIAGQKGKRIKYLLTTNGLLLDEDKVDYLDSFGVQYILSIDGNLSTQLLNRPALKGEKYPFGRLVKNMRALQAKKADFFVNLVIGPSNLGELEDNVEFFLEHGVKNFRFSYELGIHWSPVHTGIYFYRLFRVITQGLDDKDVEVINIGADDEPFLASPALTVDYDGKVYCGCTITLEKLFLNLRKINLVGRIGTDDSMERIRKTRSGAINDLLTFYPEGSRLNKLVLNNLGLGFISDGFFNGLFKKKSKEQIALLSEGKTVNSLMVMCTYACQLACDYCEVKRSGASMSPASLYRAIDLLLTTRSNECQLRFWGGEPLLKWGLIKKGVFYAEKKAAQRNKSVKFMITTNGLLLDSRKISFLRKHPVEVMFSLDGAPETNDMHRFSRGKTKLGMRPLEKLKLLIGSGVPYFINIVATARTAGDLAGNLSYLNGLGVERAQLCYRCGEIWPRARMEKLIAQIKIFLEKSSGREFLMNFKNNCEPTMLSQEVIVDTDEKVYFDAAIFMENKFPGLRGNYYLGDASDIKCIDTLYAAKRWLHEKFQGACSNKEERAALENNIGLGLRVEDAFSGFSKTSLDSNENPRLIPIVKGDFFAQRPILGALGIDSLFLYIDGPCFNNCLFCRHKQEDFSDIFKIEARLRSNLKIGAVKLSVIGNEPLLHPEIGQILRLAKKYGFRNIEMMTSGELLGRRDFFREIIEAGASSFSLPIFSREEKTHDAIVGRKGSLGMILAGIKNAMDYSTKVFVHTNLIRQNLDHLPGLERFVKEGLSLPFVILPVRPKTANLAYEKLVPSYGAIIKKLRHTESLVGFPLCVVNKVQKNLFKDKDELSQSIKLYLLDQNFIKLRSCAECSYKNKCLGVFKDHFYLYPKDRLEPFLKNDKLKSRPV